MRSAGDKERVEGEKSIGRVQRGDCPRSATAWNLETVPAKDRLGKRLVTIALKVKPHIYLHNITMCLLNAVRIKWQVPATLVLYWNKESLPQESQRQSHEPRPKQNDPCRPSIDNNEIHLSTETLRAWSAQELPETSHNFEVLVLSRAAGMGINRLSFPSSVFDQTKTGHALPVRAFYHAFSLISILLQRQLSL